MISHQIHDLQDNILIILEVNNLEYSFLCKTFGSVQLIQLDLEGAMQLRPAFSSARHHSVSGGGKPNVDFASAEESQKVSGTNFKTTLNIRNHIVLKKMKLVKVSKRNHCH